MRALRTTAAAILVLTAAALADDGAWMTDLEKAFAKAAAEGKPVLAQFTGSDWCPPCKMMHKEVFSKEAFLERASKDFILVEIDVPKDDEDVHKKNFPLLQEYKVRGLPTVVLFRADATEFDRFSAASFPSLEEFFAKLDIALARKDFL